MKSNGELLLSAFFDSYFDFYNQFLNFLFFGGRDQRLMYLSCFDEYEPSRSYVHGVPFCCLLTIQDDILHVIVSGHPLDTVRIVDVVQLLRIQRYLYVDMVVIEKQFVLQMKIND